MSESGSDVAVAPDGHDSPAAADTISHAPARVMPVRFGSPWPRLIAILSLLAALAFSTASFWSLAGLLVVFLVLDWLRRSWFLSRAVERAGDGIRIGSKVYAKGDIRAAIPLREKEQLVVRISRSLGRRVDIEVESEEAAEGLLSELGLSAGSSAMSFPVRPASMKVRAILPAAIIMLAYAAVSLALRIDSLNPLTLLMAGVSTFLFEWLYRASLVVGTDGIQVRGATKSVFYSHAAIASVEVRREKVIVHLRRGEPIELTTAFGKGPTPSDAELARRIGERILAARLAAETNEVDEASAVSLQRGGRTPAEWVLLLRQMGGAPEASYRQASVSRAALLATLENPAARALARLAAAVSLAQNLTPEEAPRLRVAIDTCAQEKLQARLRIAVEPPSQDALEQALLETEAEGESPGSRGNIRGVVL